MCLEPWEEFPPGAFLFSAAEVPASGWVDQEVRQMSEPWWKKIGEVAIEIAAATVVIVTTVFIERCLRTVGEENSGSTAELDGDEGSESKEGSKSNDR